MHQPRIPFKKASILALVAVACSSASRGKSATDVVAATDTTTVTSDVPPTDDDASTGDTPGSGTDADAASPDEGQPVAPDDGIGWGDGAVGSVPLEVIFTPPRPYQATDLDFNPVRDELWVTLREFPVTSDCGEFTGTETGCRALEGDAGWHRRTREDGAPVLRRPEDRNGASPRHHG